MGTILYTTKTKIKISEILSFILALIISFLINQLLTSFINLKSILLVFQEIVIYNLDYNLWDVIVIILYVITYIQVLFFVNKEIQDNIKLMVFRLNLKVIKEFKSLKNHINENIIELIDTRNDELVNQKDIIYADLIRQMHSEFDIQGVLSHTIMQCVDRLDDIVKNKEIKVQELYATTDLYNDSWLSRTMLIYMVKTIQMAEKIDKNKKRRFFIRNNHNSCNDKESYKVIKALHENILPIEEITFDNYHKKTNNTEHQAFLLLKMDTQQFFWYVDDNGMKRQWLEGNSISNPNKAKELNDIVNKLINKQ